ncbi:plasmid stability protein [Salmonella enterica]|nr:plasmid stability protein [Salmonella enterica]
MGDERKKFTVYLHPDQAADNMSLDIIDSVPRSERGELYRRAFISGLALHQLDPRIPGLLTVLLDRDFSVDQLVGLLSQTTGWKPSRADIRDILAELGAGQATQPPQSEVIEDEEKQRLELAREKMKKFI